MRTLSAASLRKAPGSSCRQICLYSLQSSTFKINSKSQKKIFLENKCLGVKYITSKAVIHSTKVSLMSSQLSDGRGIPCFYGIHRFKIALTKVRDRHYLNQMRITPPRPTYYSSICVYASQVVPFLQFCNQNFTRFSFPPLHNPLIFMQLPLSVKVETLN